MAHSARTREGWQKWLWRRYAHAHAMAGHNSRQGRGACSIFRGALLETGVGQSRYCKYSFSPARVRARGGKNRGTTPKCGKKCGIDLFANQFLIKNQYFHTAVIQTPAPPASPLNSIRPSPGMFQGPLCVAIQDNAKCELAMETEVCATRPFPARTQVIIFKRFAAIICVSPF